MIPLITLEEHYIDRDVLEAAPEDEKAHQAMFPQALRDRLLSLGEDRIEAMDESSVSVQVLSHGPIHPLSVELCRGANDKVHAASQRYPGRLKGFAYLPIFDGDEAAKELERCVNELGFVGALLDNHYKGQYYDSKKFWPVFEMAEKLDVPIYLHPTFPTEDMNKVLYGSQDESYDDKVEMLIGAFGFGWHADTALHVMKLFGSGLFDAYPKLQLVLGHMGELLPYQLDRIVGASRAAPGFSSARTRSFRQVWDENFHITTSGMFSLAPFACLLRTTSPKRILCSVDYPFSGNEKGRAFWEEVRKSDLGVDEEQLKDMMYRNAERLLKIKAEQFVG